MSGWDDSKSDPLEDISKRKNDLFNHRVTGSEYIASKVRLILAGIEAQAGMHHWGMESASMLSVDQAMTELGIIYHKYYIARLKVALEAERPYMSPGKYRHVLAVIEKAIK